MDPADILDTRIARLTEIRAMAGRALLSGPKEYTVSELEGPLLDLAVANAAGLKAFIHLVDNAISPFYECCVLNGSGRLQYQFQPSRSWSQGGPIIELERIHLIAPTGASREFWATIDPYLESIVAPPTGANAYGKSPLEAAMRCYVIHKLGSEVTL